LWLGKEADGSVDTTTPSKSDVRDEMGRLEKVSYPLFVERQGAEICLIYQLVKKHERGDMPKSEWLDKLVFRRMSEIHAVRNHMVPHGVYMVAPERNEGRDRKIE
jgi:phosphatidylinositol 3-kinase